MTLTQTSATVGDTLPPMTLPLLTGGDLDLDDLRGERVLLYIWGSW